MEDEKEAAAIRRGVLRLARRLRTERPEGALSTNKTSVLAHLLHHGPTTPGDLAAAERQQPQSLTRVFADLEGAGLVSRTRSAADRRQVLLAITEEGRRAFTEDMAQRDVWLGSALGGLNHTERQVLILAAGLMDRLATTD
ncbi:MarR family winged helix-turn-helix transcriptional regulator [Kitasatospora sp. NPDC051170]|uniref:MarR family winged helix-turn-helix transcriptional regulator n=1 Tax=Kitasatospora sp. NPDC051170 TaxID=3364056 RepID=UPI0037BA10CA